MKKIIIILVILTAGITTTYAKSDDYPKDKLQLAIKNYLHGLKSDNIGVRNSVLHQLAVVKARFPNADYSEVEKQIEKLSKKDSELLIRLNANLMCCCLKNLELLDKIDVKTVDPNEFFSELYTQITETTMFRKI
ncbi:hypothetical protein JXQ31_18720 [candidate division KSB1 bacterium]|nr:hypothetical protein [candidate division KSB1 bacterium]